MKKMMDEDSNPNDADDMKGHGPGSIHKMPHTMPHINDSPGMNKGGFGKPAGAMKTTAKHSGKKGY